MGNWFSYFTAPDPNSDPDRDLMVIINLEEIKIVRSAVRIPFLTSINYQAFKANESVHYTEHCPNLPVGTIATLIYPGTAKLSAGELVDLGDTCWSEVGTGQRLPIGNKNDTMG
jgi:hypothetical protein